jgi:hypothetical protein
MLFTESVKEPYFFLIIQVFLNKSKVYQAAGERSIEKNIRKITAIGSTFALSIVIITV